MASLRKDSWTDGYVASGSLEGIDGPGRRTVRRLEIRRVTKGSSVGIQGVDRFPDLTWLALSSIEDGDLSPLRGLTLDALDLQDVRDCDLAPIEEVKALRRLGLVDVSPLPIQCLRLPSSLESLMIINDERHAAHHVADLVEAIDWSRLTGLRDLQITAGDGWSAPVVLTDLGFLTHLPELVTLRMEEGVAHAGPGASPLEPPFAGLSRKLRWVRISAVDPEPLKAAFEAFIQPPGDDVDQPQGVSVYPRDSAPAEPAWTIRAFESDDGFGVYGSLQQALGQGPDETEYEAAERAQSVLASAQPELAKRLDFDPEANGTGIYAASRKDLEAVIEILGLAQ